MKAETALDRYYLQIEESTASSLGIELFKDDEIARKYVYALLLNGKSEKALSFLGIEISNAEDLMDREEYLSLRMVRASACMHIGNIDKAIDEFSYIGRLKPVPADSAAVGNIILSARVNQVVLLNFMKR